MAASPLRPLTLVSSLAVSSLAGFSLVAACLVAVPALAAPDTPARTSERLVAVGNGQGGGSSGGSPLGGSPGGAGAGYDYASAAYTSSLADLDEKIKLKSQTLADLKGAVDQAKDDAKTQLRYQLLTEKRDFIRLSGTRLDLRRARLEARRDELERLLRRRFAYGPAYAPDRSALVQRQEEARRRFESSLATVDLRLFRSDSGAPGRLSDEQSRNLQAIESLQQAIKSHPMNAGRGIDAEPGSRDTQLRSLLNDTAAELALLDQEGRMLSFMAKLLALDAMALTQERDRAGLEPAERGGADRALSSAVPLFLSR